VQQAVSTSRECHGTFYGTLRRPLGRISDLPSSRSSGQKSIDVRISRWRARTCVADGRDDRRQHCAEHAAADRLTGKGPNIRVADAFKRGNDDPEE
jgi:hypothetical protein